MRPAFDRYVDWLAQKNLDPQRRKLIEMTAASMFGDRFRHPTY